MQHVQSHYTSKHIADMLSKIEAIIDAEDFIHQVEENFGGEQ